MAEQAKNPWESSMYNQIYNSYASPNAPTYNAQNLAKWAQTKDEAMGWGSGTAQKQLSDYITSSWGGKDLVAPTRTTTNDPRFMTQVNNDYMKAASAYQNSLNQARAELSTWLKADTQRGIDGKTYVTYKATGDTNKPATLGLGVSNPYQIGSGGMNWDQFQQTAPVTDLTSVMEWAKSYTPYLNQGTQSALGSTNDLAAWAVNRDWQLGLQPGTSASKLNDQLSRLAVQYPDSRNPTPNSMNDYYSLVGALSAYMAPKIGAGGVGQKYTYKDGSQAFVPNEKALSAPGQLAVSMGLAATSGRGGLVPTSLGKQVGWYEGWVPNSTDPINLSTLRIEQPQARQQVPAPAPTPAPTATPAVSSSPTSTQAAVNPTQQPVLPTTPQTATQGGACPTCGRPL
jgi:hypothetical protein